MILSVSKAAEFGDVRTAFWTENYDAKQEIELKCQAGKNRIEVVGLEAEAEAKAKAKAEAEADAKAEA